MSALTAPVAERIRELHAIGLPLEDIAGQTGIRIRAVNEVVRGRRDGRPLNAREQAEEDERTGWAPLCLDAAEWALWRRTNPLGFGHMASVARPCDDCPLGFAADMRAAGRCNGTPGWTAPEHEEPAVTPEETHPMIEPIVLPPADGTPVNRAQRGVIASEAVARHNGDRKAAAAELGVTTQVLGLAIHHAERAQAADHRPAKNKPAAKAETVPVPPQLLHTVVEAAEAPRHTPDLVMVAPVSAPERERPLAERLAHEAPLAVSAALGRAAVAARTLCDILELEADTSDAAGDLHRRARNLRRDIAVAFTDATMAAQQARPGFVPPFGQPERLP